MPDDDDDDFYYYYSSDPPIDDDDSSDEGGASEETTEQNKNEGISIPMLKLESLEQNFRLIGKSIEEDDGQHKGLPAFLLYRAKIPGGWLVLMMQQDTEHFTPPGHKPYGIGWGYGGATFIPDPCHAWNGSSID